MRFRFIAVEKAEHTVTILCRCLRVTRSGFYAWQRRPESTHARDDRRLTVLVRASFEESEHRYGSPRVHEDLLEQHEQVSRKRVVRLMQEDGLHARLRKRYTLTTMSDHDHPVAANLLDRQFTADAPNQRWVGDTTEFVIGSSGKLYLAAILDLFSRFIVGWAVSAVNDRHLTINALEMALKRRCPEIGLLHHSDRGSTYASEDYQDVLDARGIVCSMSRRGNCWDNAVMESFFSTVKSELADRFDSGGDAKIQLFDYVEVFYNQRRRHSTLGQISLAAYERRAITEGMDAMENCTDRVCVQRRLACSVGDSPTEARVRRLVAWVAGRKEIEFLKSTDKAIYGMVSESSGRNNRERKVTSKCAKPQGPSLYALGEGSMSRRTLTDAADHLGGATATAR
jgi:putative transposase